MDIYLNEKKVSLDKYADLIHDESFEKEADAETKAAVYRKIILDMIEIHEEYDKMLDQLDVENGWLREQLEDMVAERQAEKQKAYEQKFRPAEAEFGSLEEIIANAMQRARG